ncbi:MAG: RNA methyltransferase [Ignavibacteriaceae bacterium]|nr:RNA methyltransferase [Ignavibacteriaceae bacterium]
MISKNKLKYYSLLLKKKHRELKKQFIVEGLKSIEEGLNSNYTCEAILVTDEYENNTREIPKKYNVQIETLNEEEFRKLSDTVTPQGIAAVFNYPPEKDINKIRSELIVCLENIGDPGNLGTMIRNCDWFGITDIVLSKNSTDPFSPKTVRSSMGSIFHINIYDQTDLDQFLESYKKKGYKVLCADTEGEDIYGFQFEGKGILILSSESHGPSVDILRLSDHRITIPKFGKGESLNVASASAVILSCLAKRL